MQPPLDLDYVLPYAPTSVLIRELNIAYARWGSLGSGEVPRVEACYFARIRRRGGQQLERWARGWKCADKGTERTRQQISRVKRRDRNAQTLKEMPLLRIVLKVVCH